MNWSARHLEEYLTMNSKRWSSFSLLLTQERKEMGLVEIVTDQIEIAGLGVQWTYVLWSFLGRSVCGFSHWIIMTNISEPAFVDPGRLTGPTYRYHLLAWEITDLILFKAFMSWFPFRNHCDKLLPQWFSLLLIPTKNRRFLPEESATA